MVSDRFFKNKLLALCFFLIGAKPSYKGKGLDISLLYPRAVLRVGGIFLIFPFGKILSKQTEDGFLPFPGRGAATLIAEFPKLTIIPVHIEEIQNNSNLFSTLFKRKKLHIVIGNPFRVTEPEKKSINSISHTVVQRIFSLKHVSNP